MGASRIGGIADREMALTAFRVERCGAPHTWSNGPGDRYGRHVHGYHKVLFCPARRDRGGPGVRVHRGIPMRRPVVEPGT